MPLPDFVIVGAQRCGTTTLHELLRCHPGVWITLFKETHFFDTARFENGLDWYSQQFPARLGRRKCGERTPVYMYDRVSRERMAEVLPEARLLVVLRDPVKRAYSHYWHNRKRGVEKLATFEEAIEAEPRRLRRMGRLAQLRLSYLDRGHYIDQLEALEKYYRRDQLHVMLLDDVINHTQPTMRSICEFLGIDTKPVPTLSLPMANAFTPEHNLHYRRKSRRAIARATLRQTRRRAGETLRAAGQLAGRMRPGLERPVDQEDPQGTALGSLQGRAQLPLPDAYPLMNHQTRERLVTYYAEDNQRLGAWLERDLSAWSRR